MAEAKATLAEASSNANRARSIQDSGALSQQQIGQYLTAETNAKARLHAAQANLHAKNIRLGQAVVKAPDDGVISLNPATVGTVYGVGKELFRLIRKGRIEWRAELTSADLSRIKSGMKATITLPDKSVIQGTVRTISPVVDARTRNAIVYVDIPAGSASIGMFARGDFMLGAMESLTLPNDAIVMRDGFAYVMQVETIGNSQQARIRQVQVKLGQRSGKRVALLNFNCEADFVAVAERFLRMVIPCALLPTLKAQPKLAYCHEYFQLVDPKSCRGVDSIYAADPGGQHEFQGDENPAVSGSGFAYGHCHCGLARRFAGSAGNPGRAKV